MSANICMWSSCFVSDTAQVYTRIMRTLVAVNPFQTLPIYSTQHIDQYMGISPPITPPLQCTMGWGVT